MKHLTTIDNIKNSTRFVSDKINDKRISIYIEESEQVDIKKQIGEPLFIDLIDYVNSEDKSSFPDYSVLLDGGVYEIEGCSGKEKRILNGIVKSLNYYVWARLVKNNNYTLTRYGLVNKDEPYSDNASLKERLALEKDTLSIADQYLSECIDYLNHNKNTFTLFNKGFQKNRLNIKIIRN